jgi:hypothetical protein
MGSLRLLFRSTVADKKAVACYKLFRARPRYSLHLVHVSRGPIHNGKRKTLMKFSDYNCQDWIRTDVGSPGYADLRTVGANDALGSFQCFA